jgi:hypothetical protein
MAESSGAGVGAFIGNSVGEAAAFAAGFAIGPMLEPLVQALRNETWKGYPDRPLDAEVAAEAVAEGYLSSNDGGKEAALTGIAQTPFGTLVELARTAPAVAEARELMRRSAIGRDDLHLAYRKAKIDPQWFDALDVLLVAPLPPAVAALAAVRGLIADEGTLPVGPPTEEGKIRAFPVYPISGKASAAAAGLSEDAYAVMVGINGRPMSLHEAASAYFRGIIELSDYYRAVSEGDTRNEWRDAILDQARQILSAHDYVELHLRGWIAADEMYAGTARHGMSQADTDLQFKVLGRPITVHQITTGEARGGVYDGPTDQIPTEYLKSMQESNSRPEWYNLEYANRYTLPGYFVIKAMLSAGSLTEAEGAELFKQEGWPPDLADKAAAALAPGSGSGGKTLTRAEVKQAWREGHLTDADVLTRLQAEGLSAADAQLVLSTWKSQAANSPTTG